MGSALVCSEGHVASVRGTEELGGIGWFCPACDRAGELNVWYFRRGNDLRGFPNGRRYYYGVDFHAAKWGHPGWERNGDGISLNLEGYELWAAPIRENQNDGLGGWVAVLTGPGYCGDDCKCGNPECDDGQLELWAVGENEAKEQLLDEVWLLTRANQQKEQI